MIRAAAPTAGCGMACPGAVGRTGGAQGWLAPSCLAGRLRAAQPGESQGEASRRRRHLSFCHPLNVAATLPGGSLVGDAVRPPPPAPPSGGVSARALPFPAVHCSLFAPKRPTASLRAASGTSGLRACRDGLSELAETGSRTQEFVISFISLSIKFIAGSIIQSVLLTGSEC